MEKKTLKECNLLDRFLFARTIEDTQTYQDLLDVLLGEDINLLTQPQTEKELRTAPWLRSIRVDVYSMDDKKKIYNTEPQAMNTYNLPKRSRYYQSLIDSSLLEPGTKNFNLLNDTVLVMIMPFDLFGYGKYRYTFVPKCREVEDLELEDGTIRIFFNTHGTNKDEVSEDLIELLDFFENTTENPDELSKNEKIRRIQEQVNRIKSSEAMGVRYMQEWEEKLMFQEKGIEMGKELGQERVNRLNKALIEHGRTNDLLRAAGDMEFQKKLFEELGIE